MIGVPAVRYMLDDDDGSDRDERGDQQRPTPAGAVARITIITPADYVVHIAPPPTTPYVSQFFRISRADPLDKARSDRLRPSTSSNPDSGKAGDTRRRAGYCDHWLMPRA